MPRERFICPIYSFPIPIFRNRDNWLPLFDDVTSIIFITSLSEFDQTLAEDSEVNRTAESLFLFKSVLKNDVLKKIPIILFLNKKDLLEEKLNSKEKVR